MLLHYLVKGGCSKFLPITGFVTISLTGRHPDASARDTVAFLERERCEKRVVVYALVSVYAVYISSMNSGNFEPICHVVTLLNKPYSVYCVLIQSSDTVTFMSEVKSEYRNL